MVFEKNTWWNHCVPFFPQMGTLASVLSSLFSPLVKGGPLLPAWRDPHRRTELPQTLTPAPLLKQVKETTERLKKKRVWDKVAWKGMGDSIETQHRIPPELGHQLWLECLYHTVRSVVYPVKQGLCFICILVEFRRHVSSPSTDFLSRDKWPLTADSGQSFQALSSGLCSSPTETPRGLHTYWE